MPYGGDISEENTSGAFNQFSVTDKELKRIFSGIDYPPPYRVNQDSPARAKLGIRLNLPAGVRKQGYLIIFSHKAGNVIYQGSHGD